MKKSIQRTTKPKGNKGIVTSGVGNQTQSVNVTVNLPKEVTKKRRQPKPKSDSKKKKAIQDLKDAMLAYQSAKDSAISEGKTIPDELLISSQAMGSVDTITEIQSLLTELQERTVAINQIPIPQKVSDEPQDITMFSSPGKYSDNIFGTTTVRASPFSGGDSQGSQPSKVNEGDPLSQLNDLESIAKKRLEEDTGDKEDVSNLPGEPSMLDPDDSSSPANPIIPSGNATEPVVKIESPEVIAAAEEIVSAFIKTDGRTKDGIWNMKIRDALRDLGVDDTDITKIGRLKGKPRIVTRPRCQWFTIFEYTCTRAYS